MLATLANQANRGDYSRLKHAIIILRMLKRYHACKDAMMRREGLIYIQNIPQQSIYLSLSPSHTHTHSFPNLNYRYALPDYHIS